MPVQILDKEMLVQKLNYFSNHVKKFIKFKALFYYSIILPTFF